MCFQVVGNCNSQPCSLSSVQSGVWWVRDQLRHACCPWKL